MTWISGYLAVGLLVALILRPLTPGAWIAHVALWPLALLAVLFLLTITTRTGEIAVAALSLLALILPMSWHWGALP